MIQLLLSTTKGLTFVMVVLTASSSNAEKNWVDLDALYTIFEAIAKPLLQSVQIQISQDNDTSEQDGENNVIEPEVKEQAKKLSFVPNNHISNKKPLFNEDSEETVILEVPSSAEIDQNRRKGDSPDIVTNDSFPKYKELQQKIETLLNKEKISDKTKELLSNALEKVMDQINRPCASNNQSKDLTPKTNRRLLGEHGKKARKTMLKSWKQRFNDLIDRYREDDSSDTFDSKKNWKFLSKLQDLFFEMHNDFQNLTRRKDFNCNVVNVRKIGRTGNKNTIDKKIAEPGKKTTAVKQVGKSDTKSIVAKHITNSTYKNKIREKSAACQFHQICPYELKVFLTDFYTHLLDKLDLVFHNYVKMYFVDMSKESSSERKMFTRVIDAVKNQVEKKYNETIAKEKVVVLDSSSDINAKVENIKKIIDKTVEKVKTLIQFALTDKGHAEALPSKIQSVVKSDIMTNADIELSLVKDKFKSKMCKSFETCYGKDRRKKRT